MRSLPVPVAVAVSAVGHVGLVLFVDRCDPPPPRTEARETATTIELLPSPVDPWESHARVGELSMPEVEPDPSPKPHDSSLGMPAMASRASRASEATTEIASATTETGIPTATDNRIPVPQHTGPRNRYLDMRRGSPQLSLPEGRWNADDRAPAGTTPERDLSTGQLQPDGGGTHRSDQGAFTAKVAKDGSVTLEDKRNVRIRVAIPTLSDIATGIQAWYYDPNKPVGTLPPDKITRQPRIDREAVAISDRIQGRDEKAVYGEDRGPSPTESDGGGGILLPLFDGGFDVTDAFMRQKGIDPYASKKLAFLDSTRDERVQIGNAHKRRQLGQVAQLVQANLTRLWATVRDPAERKQALFELWDECVETGSDDMVIAGREARALVVGFIRARLPAGSAHAYTADELAAHNRAKKSQARFAPYDDE